MNKKWFFILVFVFFLAQCKKQSDVGKTPTPVDQAAASESKVILSIADVSLSNRDLKNFIKLQYSDVFEQKNNDKLLSRLFDIFCEQQIIWFKAKQSDIQVGDDEINATIKEVQSRRQDLDIDRQMIRNVLKVQKYLLAKAYKDIEVSDSEVARFYEANLKEFRKNEEIQLFQIMVNDREKLLAIRSELLEQPSRFEEIARSKSVSPEAANSGSMGFFEKGMLPQEMEEVVFSLKVNEISPIVESPYGFHLFKITRKRKSRMLLLAAVKDEIKSKLLSAKMSSAYGKFLKGLQAEVPVRINYENLYFTYIKSDSGVNKDENKNFSDSDHFSDN
ncbi:MAG TPA: peptidylprolyl isomerase [Patescibacteria group bacterium]|nr:peptidylprolyl isomerase [Patescibacteria group bacterium]